MFSFARLTSLICAIALAGGPFLTAPAQAQPAAAQVAQSTGSAVVSGVVSDANGAPISGAALTFSGPQAASATTDDEGAYSVNLVPGTYKVSVEKGGYQRLSEQDFSVPSTDPQTLNASIVQTTFSSLKVIGGTTSASGVRGQFNTGTASIETVSASVFKDQGQIQVGRILDQQPGVIMDRPATSVNNAAPGSINFPSVRGAFGNETANLVDGHQLANGQYGDYVSSFLNSFMLQSIEIVKGPGAAAPQVVNGIGGTVNFRTKDTTPYLTGSGTYGLDSWGGKFSNIDFSDPIGKKFQFRADLAVYGTLGPLNQSGYFTFDSFNDEGYCVGGTWTPAGGCTGVASNNSAPQTAPPLPGVQRSPFTTQYLVACCIPLTSQYLNRSELVKGKVLLSDTTQFTMSFLGSQTLTDQNGNHVYTLASTFDPTFAGHSATYTGSLPAGPLQIFDNVYEAPPYEINNEPMFQGELRTSFGDNSLLFRYFGASINRLQYGGVADPNGAYGPVSYNLYGTFKGADGNYHTYDGQLEPITFFPYQQYCVATSGPPVACGSATATATTLPQYRDSAETRSMEEDKIQGGTFELDHPLGDNGDVLTFALDANGQKSHVYSFDGQLYAPSIPLGTGQQQQTFLLRGLFNVGSRFSAMLSNYLTSFQNRYTTDVGATFQNSSYSRYDGRVGLTYRATPDASIRFAAGSSFSPAYASILDVSATAPAYNSATLYFTNTLPSGNISPETAFGYDLGTDIRLDTNTLLVADGYLTNLYGQFAQTSYVSNPAYNGVDTHGNPITAPLYSSQYLNLGQSKYYGIELAVRNDPPVGLGIIAQGSLTRAYPVSIPASLYCGNLACTTIAPSAIIVGPNFQNGGSSGSGASFSTLQNHAIPYSNGYLEVHYRFGNGAYAALGGQYIGPNNSSNEPAYTIGNATLRIPIVNPQTNLQISVDNIWDTYPATAVVEAGGVPVQLNNGKIGLTNANDVGPTTFRVSVTRYFGRQ